VAWIGSAPGGKQVEALRQALQHLRGRERLRAGRGKFDGERDAFQAPAQFGHGPGVAGGDPEIRPHRLRPIHKQLNARN
jgi:hypothetical protein